MNITDIQQERGITLPNDYLDFLSTLDQEYEYCFNDDADEDPDFEGRCWAFFDEAELCKEIEMFQVGTAPSHQQLALYLKCYQEASDNQMVYSPDGELPIERVINGFVVADDNGDLLYLDPEDDFSVWIYFHDGSDVKKVSNSMKEWLAQATCP